MMFAYFFATDKHVESVEDSQHEYAQEADQCLRHFEATALSVFVQKIKSYDKAVLPLNKVCLAFHVSHPEYALSSDIRPKLLKALRMLADLKEIRIDDKDWDTHPSTPLPHHINVVRKTKSTLQMAHC